MCTADVCHNPPKTRDRDGVEMFERESQGSKLAEVRDQGGEGGRKRADASPIWEVWYRLAVPRHHITNT